MDSEAFFDGDSSGIKQNCILPRAYQKVYISAQDLEKAYAWPLDIHFSKPDSNIATRLDSEP